MEVCESDLAFIAAANSYLGAHEHNHANAVKKDNVDQKDREEQDAVHQTLNAQALKKIQEVEESTSNAQGAGK